MISTERAASERTRDRQTGDTQSDAWRSYFTRLVEQRTRFAFGRDYLERDMAGAMRRILRRDARVLEVGVGSGHLLASLPNEDRTGIDILPQALKAATERDPRMQIVYGDALTLAFAERFDAIVCDRLCHSVADVQQMLDRMAAHLAPNGRIFMTCFNFLWQGPLAVGSRLGLVVPSPPDNWLSASDFENLFSLTGLESVAQEDRILLPVRVPVLDPLLNRYLVKAPPFQTFSLYRIYTLRCRQVPRPPPRVSVVVPARNEAGNVAAVVQRTPVMGAGTELIFVEGGSNDGTYEEIERAIARYQGPLQVKLHRQEGSGKADAVRLGFARATGDLLMILDADLTVPPEELPKFYVALVSGQADYVHGTRLVYPMEDRAMPSLNKLANAIFAKAFSYLLGMTIKDTLCGTKVCWRADYEQITADRAYFGVLDPFGDFDLIFGANRLKLKIMEVPVRYRARTYGETNISRFRHGILLLRMSLLAARKLKFV